MTQTYNSNQFTITDVKGRLANPSNFNTLNRRISPASTNAFYSGTAVKLLANGTVEKANATDTILGIIFYNPIKSTYLAGESVGIALTTSEIKLEAGGTINAGDKIEINPTGDLVIASAGTNPTIGTALQSASSGNLLTVILSF